jgi:hypothetical protein
MSSRINIRRTFLSWRESWAMRKHTQKEKSSHSETRFSGTSFYVPLPDVIGFFESGVTHWIELVVQQWYQETPQHETTLINHCTKSLQCHWTCWDTFCRSGEKWNCERRCCFKTWIILIDALFKRKRS